MLVQRKLSFCYIDAADEKSDKSIWRLLNKGINIENDKRQVVIYARVSTRNQKDDLQNQVVFLR